MSRVECWKLSSVSVDIAVAIFRVMATAMSAETLDNFQHSMSLIPKSRSCTLNYSRENLRPRIFNNTYSEMTNYNRIWSNINFIEMYTNYYRATHYFKSAPATVGIWPLLLEKLTFYGRTLKSIACVTIACVTIARKAAKIRIAIFQILRSKENTWVCIN
jgi:hypothetical protein